MSWTIFFLNDRNVVKNIFCFVKLKIFLEISKIINFSWQNNSGKILKWPKWLPDNSVLSKNFISHQLFPMKSFERFYITRFQNLQKSSKISRNKYYFWPVCGHSSKKWLSSKYAELNFDQRSKIPFFSPATFRHRKLPK